MAAGRWSALSPGSEADLSALWLSSLYPTGGAVRVDLSKGELESERVDLIIKALATRSCRRPSVE